jgi:response regulator RpfG family c-di-GMP phosphodiesterase
MKKTFNNDNSNITILLLDDEINILETIKGYLEVSGYNCLITDDPEEAVKIIKDKKPVIDIFITDYLMVKLTAIQVIETIRKFDTHLYIILLTGYANNMPGMYAIQNLEIDSYAEKTASFDDLMLKIEIAVKSISKLNPQRKIDDGLQFHEKLKKLRLESNKTQDDVATYLGVGRTTIVNYEHGRIKPTLENIRKLAELFNVSCDYLLENG